MRFAACLVLALLAACLSAPVWADGGKITDLELIPLHPGVNQIPHMAPDGSDGIIVQGWRSNSNANGYNIFLSLIEGKIVGVSDNGKFLDSTRDFPHTGADCVKAVRFARGSVDGHETMLLITATRGLESGQATEDPATVYYDVYQLTTNGDVGTTGDYFAPVSETASEKKFCNADLALNKKFGFPLPSPFEGPNQDDGCR